MPTIFFDFDSTVCIKESLDEVITLALKEYPEKKGLVERVEKITNQGMNGELDFKESVQARLEVCPLNLVHFTLTGQHLKHCITPGFTELMTWLKAENWDIYIVSGGFLPSIIPTIEILGLRTDRLFSNGLRLDEQENVTGVDESSLLWTNAGKTEVINHLKKARGLRDRLILVGDGSNDLAAYKSGVVDDFIGFGANVVRPKVKAESPHFVTSVEALRQVLEKIN
ncbi:HAD-IB family phosphatase [bacterium]|nr:HAD-IB family phosphatase [bacterium]NCQ54857.1 HAD-IB family phosphatase [Candidatus Parcubacteria bacterium]NCS66901.1 HAD-IB family phosphatase [Candidatus Peregrinibacteria bacterium]NCS95847.1 HAD-IB family phosphatase [bacterium]